VNSPWTLDAYLTDCSGLRGRCVVWPAGVDTAFWTAAPMRPGRRALVFDKLPPGEKTLLDTVLACMTRAGYEANILRHGSFTPREYLSELQRATVLVGLSLSESQGLAWAEAWAANVPTLIYARDHHWYGTRRIESSSAPYLSDATGSFFSSAEKLELQLNEPDTRWRRARPRDWVLAHMSDQVCAAKFCELAGIGIRGGHPDEEIPSGGRERSRG